MTAIPHWKVQAALRLLGYDPDKVSALEIWNGVGQIVMTPRDVESQTTTPISFDRPEDTRMHVLGIDPENGNAELSVVEDNDVKFYAGANMYLASGSKHANGTVCPTFKRLETEKGG